jgi:hypothetical protein
MDQISDYGGSPFQCRVGRVQDAPGRGSTRISISTLPIGKVKSVTWSHGIGKEVERPYLAGMIRRISQVAGSWTTKPNVRNYDRGKGSSRRKCLNA